MKKIILTFLIAIVGGVSGMAVYKYFEKEQGSNIVAERVQPARLTNFFGDSDVTGLVDFTYAASVSTPTVVHIKSSYDPRATGRSNNPLADPFRDFFNDDFWGFGRPPRQAQPHESFGSGVIISNDGYIVTNNHVVKNADRIDVTLHDNRAYKARVVGTDPSTDIALIKIEGDDFPAIAFGNSDEVLVGQWVLAVGNPFNLSSTVTAGIVSAKGRNINILDAKYAIESFIQTDAAVNPGNSGGALVNLKGDLVGINTAIATPTGTYAGYSFAVPVNIVRKVVDDLRKYGVVQRGYLGVFIRDINSDLAKKMDIDNMAGVYVDSLVSNGASQKAGMKAGDIILKIGNISVNSAPELQELVARYRPGDKVNVTIDRKGQKRVIPVVLKNSEGKTEIIRKEKVELLQVLGVEFEELSKKESNKLNIVGGIRVKKLYNGKLKRATGMRDGFIITKVDNIKISTIDDFVTALNNKKGGVLLEGVYPNYSGIFYYGLGL